MCEMSQKSSPFSEGTNCSSRTATLGHWITHFRTLDHIPTMNIRIGCCLGWTFCAITAGPLWGQPPNDDPIGDVAAEMHVVVGHLARRVTGETTQTAQRKVVNKLDLLIEQLEQQQQQLRNSGRVNPRPTRPAADSTVRNGPGGSGALHAARRDGDQWGELPPHERDRITQSLDNGFPAHYQKVLERYFRWLASEDKPPTETPADAAAAPTDDASSGGPEPVRQPEPGS